MATREDLLAIREELIERLTQEAYRLSAYGEERLAKVANLKTALDAVDYILANDIQPPAPADPTMMII